MGRSIFLNKREQEKKRKKKKKEKQERKEERKANSSNGSFEDMIAYVDERGLITSTPPDPENKQEVEAENIAVSTPKKEETGKILLQGRVDYFNSRKGFGFIKNTSDTEKYFFHISKVTDDITEGDLVSFELEKGQRGLNAVNITRTN